MDSNRVKGTVDELVGIAKQKTGKLTGSTKLQVDGVVKQAKGTLENTLGKTKDAVRDLREKAHKGAKRVV